MFHVKDRSDILLFCPPFLLVVKAAKEVMSFSPTTTGAGSGSSNQPKVMEEEKALLLVMARERGRDVPELSHGTLRWSWRNLLEYIHEGCTVEDKVFFFSVPSLFLR